MSLISVLDNRMNPIVVKELRQGLQSWFIIIIVNLLLVALSLTCLLMVMLNPDITEEATGGRDMFQFLQILLFIATVLGVPLYVLGRLRSERNGNQVDLFFTTTLLPHKIVRGKFVAGMSLVTLLYSVCLPFMLFTYFLRGFDVPTMLFSMAFGYLITIPLIMLAIVIGTWTVPRIFAPFVMIAALAGLIPVVVFAYAITDEFLEKGIQSIFRDDGSIPITIMILGAGFLLTKLLEATAIAELSPPSSNRTCRLRIWMTLSILLTGVGLAGIAWYASSSSGSLRLLEMVLMASTVWAIIAMSLVAVVLLIAVCEPDGFSNRVMIQRPRHFLFRLIAFPYTHGASSGFLWVVLHAFAILGVWAIALSIYKTFSVSPTHLTFTTPMIDISNRMKETMTWIILVFACISAYALLAKLIMRTFFRHVPAKHTWGAFMFVAGTLLVSSMLICFAIDPRHWDQWILWKIFNPVAGSEGMETTKRVIADSLWALTMLALCIPQGFRDATRYLLERTETQA